MQKLENFKHFSKISKFRPAGRPADQRGPRVKIFFFQNFLENLHTKFQDDIFKIDKVIKLFLRLEKKKKKEEEKETKRSSLTRLRLVKIGIISKERIAGRSVRKHILEKLRPFLKSTDQTS